MAVAKSPYPDSVVYLTARGPDPEAGEHSTKTILFWTVKLERWTPEEIKTIVIDTFTRLAQEATDGRDTGMGPLDGAAAVAQGAAGGGGPDG